MNESEEPVLQDASETKKQASIPEQLHKLVVEDTNSIEDIRSGKRAGWETALGKLYMLWDAYDSKDGVIRLKPNRKFRPSGNYEELDTLLPIRIAEVKTEINPGTLLSSFMNTPKELDADIDRSRFNGIEEVNYHVREKVRSASRVFLAGAISPVSVASLAAELHANGFIGEIDCYDISPMGLETLEIFAPLIEE